MAAKQRYVTVVHLGNQAHEFAAALRETEDWDVASTDCVPPSDPADYNNPGSTFDKTVRLGPRSNAGLIARSKAIDWAHAIGVPFRERV